MLDKNLIKELQDSVIAKHKHLVNEGMYEHSSFYFDVSKWSNKGFLFDDITEILDEIGFMDDEFVENSDNIRVICLFM